MKRTIIRKASDIFDDEYESPAFIIEDEKQTKTGYWLVAESDQEYAQWYVDLPSARKAMKEEKIRSNAARALGSIRTEKKAASSRENGKKGGRPTEKKTYWILSGEGENGTWEKHTATLTGIKRIATKERCGGDRWAQIWEEIPETETTKAHIYDIDNGDMRDIPDED